MSGPVSKYVTILDRELHYVEWGDASKPKLVLWHGLARTGRDFDDLAEALSSRWHIVAPDTSVEVPSLELIARYFPHVPIRGDMSGNKAFFSSKKAERLLNWKHTL